MSDRFQRIVPCLRLDHQAEDAARFYTSIFPNSRLCGIARYSGDAAEAARAIR